jgi:hypothetical protein
LARAYAGDGTRADSVERDAEVNLKRRLQSHHPDFLLAQLVRAEVQRAQNHAAEADRLAGEARAGLKAAGATLPETIPVIF